MPFKREVIDVRVSQRILWVGSEAYPLHNIARARTLKLELKRGSVWWKYFRFIIFWIFLSVVVAFYISDGLATIVALVLIAFSTINLVRTLSTPTLYALVIETAGAPHRALISTDGNLVTGLVGRIMEAIDNPQAEFQFQVENFHVGDKIQQFGDRNIGKVSQ